MTIRKQINALYFTKMIYLYSIQINAIKKEKAKGKRNHGNTRGKEHASQLGTH